MQAMKRKPMFQDKKRMVRSANILWLLLIIAPLAYVLTVVPLEGHGLASDPSVIPFLFLGLIALSALNMGFMVLLQTSKRVMGDRAKYDPLGRAYLVMSTSAILSEAHSIYGLLLTLLSGSLAYVAGFSLIAWICLF